MTQLCSWVVSSWRRCSYRPASARRSALAPFGFACYQGIALCRGLGRGGRGHRGARPNSPHSRYRAALDVFSPHRLCGDGNRNHTPVLGIRGCCGAPGAGDQFLQEWGYRRGSVVLLRQRSGRMEFRLLAGQAIRLNRMQPESRDKPLRPRPTTTNC